MCWLVDDEGPSSELCKGQGCLNSNTGLLLLYCKLVQNKWTGKGSLKPKCCDCILFPKMLMGSCGHLLCSEGWCLGVRWDSVRPTRVLSMPSDTDRLHRPAYGSVFVLWSLWNRGGQCRILGNQILRVLLEYVIKYVWSQRQRLSTVESLRVISVHLSLTLPGGGDMGSCMCLQNSDSILSHSLPNCEVKQAGQGAEKVLKPLSKGKQDQP